jgi:hypothetical protein
MSTFLETLVGGSLGVEQLHHPAVQVRPSVMLGRRFLGADGVPCTGPSDLPAELFLGPFEMKNALYANGIEGGFETDCGKQEHEA